MTTRTDSIRNSKILVIDDHRNIRVALRLALEGEQATVKEAENCVQGLGAMGDLSNRESFPFHVVLLDIRLPDGSGLDILKKVSAAGLASRVIMISGEGTVTEAFQATQMGAFDYIEKPFAPERILVSVRRCLDFNNIQTEKDDLAKQIMRGQEILGAHPKLKDMLSMIERVAPTNGRVLILGESGTGKELVARAIHRLSERATKPLIKVNCAAIPHSLIESELFGHEKGAFTGAMKSRRGLFEQADGGTLFLDEIGELSLDVQAKLLRVLQSGEITRVGGEKTISVDVRLLTATHRDLKDMVEHQEFREDLYYRLNVVTLSVPPLRDRGDDILDLANHFLHEACHEHSIGFRQFGDKALSQLRGYNWPGNVRELKNLAERVAILSDHQTIESIDELEQRESRGANAHDQEPQKSMTPSGSVGHGDSKLFQFESELLPWQEFHGRLDKSYIKYVLTFAKGNVSEAARLLCLERAYLHRLMKKLGVQRDIVVSD